MIKNYEITYLIPKTLSEEGRKNILEKVSSYLPEGSPLAKNEKSSWACLSFQTEPQEAKSLEQKLHYDLPELRFMIVRRDPRKIKPKKQRVRKPLSETPPQKGKSKVEMEDIEKKLDEILK